jgi:glycosyltransferase involved in cell wall biosynthesis
LCKDENFAKDLEIKFIGQVAQVAIEELKKAGLEKNLNLIDNLSHNKVVVELMKSQVLLLPLNDTPNIDGVVPGKLYEYIGAKRPIICIGKPTGDAAKIINETNAGSVSDFNDTVTLLATIKFYYEQYKNNQLTIESKDYEKYSRKLLAGQIAEELNKILH